MLNFSAHFVFHWLAVGALQTIGGGFIVLLYLHLTEDSRLIRDRQEWALRNNAR